MSLGISRANVIGVFCSGPGPWKFVCYRAVKIFTGTLLLYSARRRLNLCRGRGMTMKLVPEDRTVIPRIDLRSGGIHRYPRVMSRGDCALRRSEGRSTRKPQGAAECVCSFQVGWRRQTNMSSYQAWSTHCSGKISHSNQQGLS
jgi:hypothetical protein